jgi:probable HAF family extracellular repeat protein
MEIAMSSIRPCAKATAKALVVPVVLLSAAFAHGGEPARNPPVYEVTHLAPLGGTGSRGNAINERGWVAGFADLPADAARIATLWRDDEPTPLGTLGGTHSSVPWPGLNNPGMVVGIAQTDEPDPLGEEWSCSAFIPFTGNTCLGFVWEAGRMRALPTLGGNNGFAAGVNSRGQIVGWAENDVEDPTCTGTQVLQFRAVVWEPTPDRIRVSELTPYPGDTSATAINERGQVVGISGICDIAVGRFSAVHAVLWDKGTPIDLGNIGGMTWNTPMAINDRGEVTGFANVADTEAGDFNAQAFYWSRQTGMQPLGTLPGNTLSQGHGINARGQVVGISFGGTGGNRAFFWEGGELHNLNDLVAPGYTGLLVDARDISDSGEITGSAVDHTGATVPFVARPVGRQGNP